MKRLAFLLLTVLLLAGCGYTPRGLSAGIGVDSLYIQPFGNRTSEPFLESMLTNDLILWFTRDRQMRLVASAREAEAVLSGDVASYDRTSIAYNRRDNIQEYRSEMRVNANLRRVSDGKILWKDSLFWTEESLNSADRARQDDFETEAMQNISQRLAEQIYQRIQEDF
ncbi:LPS assembly lipoprotein LptE [Trichloromonas sp.]|uniref:LPS assembly lipoprotein LptE n=1 Tax=Trichloromonas sp. TaxID=3069249 RepID=UPI002A3970D8|nr:LptE family protein [Trichloromonas sp.]